jgi:hypothetical protein
MAETSIDTNQNAEYWLRHAQNDEYSMAERLFWMKQAYDVKRNEAHALAERVTALQSQIDAFWSFVENAWHIEPRSYFEDQIAKGIGFEDSPMAMAAHHTWKRSRQPIECSCWHCGDVLELEKVHCDRCPTECDEEDCDAMGCQEPTE